jgi:hypothetical protein
MLIRQQYRLDSATIRRRLVTICQSFVRTCQLWRVIVVRLTLLWREGAIAWAVLVPTVSERFRTPVGR